MSGSRLVRGTRSRLFLYLGVVVVVGLAVYVFHGAQLQLDDARKAADKCQQQQESLSAQLQVIFEYKLRLEKSLQQEKTEHRQTREELEARAAEEKARRDKESLESTNKHAALAQQYKLLQSQHDDLSEDCKKIRVEQLHGLEERGKLEAQIQQVQASHKKSLSSLKSEYMKLEVENDQLQKQHDELLKGSSHTSDRINFLEKQNVQLQRELEKAQKELDAYKMQHPPLAGETKQQHHNEDETLKSPDKAAPSPSSPSSVSSAAPDAGLNVENQNVLQEPVINQDDTMDNKVAAQRSTTPQINPQAVLSQDRGQQNSNNNVAPVPPPRQEEKQDPAPNLPRPVVMDPANGWQHGNLPAGVVPAPHGYGAFHQNAQEAVANRKEEQNAAWAWPRFRHVPQPMEPHARERENPLDDNGPEEEEEEEDPAHPHRSAQGEQQEIPRQLQNSYQYNGADLQMEEGEEEEDDDVDQVDYGNEAGGEGARHHKAGGAQPLVKKQHDSVMVNPK